MEKNAKSQENASFIDVHGPVTRLERIVMLAICPFLVLAVIFVPTVVICAIIKGTFKVQKIPAYLFLEVYYACVPYFFFRLFRHELRRYKVLPDGLMVKFPFEKAYLVPWNEFQQVCLCSAACNTRVAYHCIAFVKKGETLNSVMRWRTDSIFHERGVFNIRYTPERLEQMTACCPMEVVDLRDTLPYRIDLYKKK